MLMIWCAVSLPPGGAGDNVAHANGVRCLSNSNFSVAPQHEEHLFVDPVIVKRPCALARWDDGNVISELLRADALPDRSPLQVEALGGGPGRRKHRRGWIG